MIDIEVMATVVRLAYCTSCTAESTSSVQHELDRVAAAVLAIEEVTATSLRIDVLNYKGRVMHTAVAGFEPSGLDSATTHAITKTPARGDALTLRWSATIPDTPQHNSESPHEHHTDLASLHLIIDHLTPAVTAAIDVLSLRESLVNRYTFGTAKGMLMERHHIDADAAFDLIKRLSQDTNTKAATIAQRVITAGSNRTQKCL